MGKLKAVGLIIFLLAHQASATSIKISCGQEGKLTSITADSQMTGLTDLEKPAGICRPTKNVQDQLEILADLAQDIPESDADQSEEKIESIKLISLDGLNRKKTDHYDRSALKEIIRHALAQGVDPYLALSIAVIEADPHALVAHMRKETRDAGFGPIHVSSTAAYTAMGCLPGGRNDFRILKSDQVKSLKDKIKDAKTDEDFQALEVMKEQLQSSAIPDSTESIQLRAEIKMLQQTESNSGIRGVLRAPSKLLFLDLTELTANVNGEGEAEQFQICSTEGGATMNSPRLKSVGESNSSNSPCCAQVKATARGGAAERALKGQLAALYIKNKIQDCVKKGGESISYCIQSFNGLGYLGSIRNQCLSNIDMATKPIYGARVADWMTNSLMANSGVNQMIAEQSADMQRPIVSLFCMKQSGARTLDSNQFLSEQRRYLAGKPDCRRFFR